MYDTYQPWIVECDRELEAHLKRFADKAKKKEAEPTSDDRNGKNTPKTRQSGKRTQGNPPRFDLRSELYRVSGVDLARIDGIHLMVAQTVIGEVGLDMSRWNTEANFSSWLGSVPTTASVAARCSAKAPGG